MKRNFTISAPAVVCIAGATEMPMGLPSLWMAVNQRLTIEALPEDSGAEALGVHRGSEILDPQANPIAIAVRETIESLDAFLGHPAEARLLPAFVKTPKSWPDAAADMLRAPTAVAAATAALKLSSALDKASSQKIAAIATGGLKKFPAAAPECLAAAIGGLLLFQASPAPSFIQVQAATGDFIVCFPATERGLDFAYYATGIAEVMGKVRASHPETDFSSGDFDAMLSCLSGLDQKTACAAYAHIRLRQILSQMMEAMGCDMFDCNRFGELLDDQREICAQYLSMDWDGCAEKADAAKKAGARGAGILLSGRMPPALLIYAGDSAAGVMKALKKTESIAMRISKDGGAAIESGGEN
ncbi:MAG TPA: hypothetical protein PL033_07215 [Candidatus Brocadiia bacterium]|nr:hypothetical protein [Candidatus Brocadiia bacterium]